MFGIKKSIMTETPSVDLPQHLVGPVEEKSASVPAFIIPMPQSMQPHPVYGFDEPRDESKFTGQGVVLNPKE